MATRGTAAEAYAASIMRPGRICVCSLAMLLCAAPALADRLPYRPLTGLPHTVSSPPFASAAPYTPLVKSLIAQLEPTNPPTPAELLNADELLHGTSSSLCTTVGYNVAPSGTNPAISPLCWSDALGINTTSGAQVRQSTAPPLRVAMASSWDPSLLNTWGQTEGAEGRWLGITGLYAPQADLLRIPNWGRNGTIFGEDPFQDGTLAAAEVNGIQGKGLMAQIKHFAMYNGQILLVDTNVQDQAARQLYLQPYEYGTSGGGMLPRAGEAASMMCSYQKFEIHPAPGASGSPPSGLAPPGGALACDNQIKNIVAHDQWKWTGFFASDYDLAMDSTIPAIESGTDQEMPTSIWFGLPLVTAVQTGVVPLKTFNDAIARILYQEERFHLLGHPDGNSNYLSPSNPTDKAGTRALTAAMKTHDAAVTERASEEGAVLLKNAGDTLPLSRRDFRKGVLVVGESAEYMPADPGTEQAVGYPDRDAISPLEQLKQFAPSCSPRARRPASPEGAAHESSSCSRITYLPYMPGDAPTPGDGIPVPQSALSTDGAKAGTGLERMAGPGAPRVDRRLDFTSLSGHGQLAFGQTYTWTGYVNVPTADNYTFHFQFSVPSYAIQNGGGALGNGGGTVVAPSCSGSGAPSFSFASSPGTGQSMSSETLASSPATPSTTPTNPTMSGYIERGLANCIYQAGALSPGMHQIQISWTAPSSFAPDVYHLREPGSSRPSFRFAFSRSATDQAAAATAARRAAKVIVFADCTCVTEDQVTSPDVNSLDPPPTALIQQMAAANHHAVVVTNTDVATLMPWLRGARSVLQMWYPGSEGGTSTARLLLGLANPGGHLTSTWPAHSSDTLWGYDETKPLYPGDSTGTHPERLQNTPPINFSEGVFVGYRFFDREGIAPLFPFGWGLSYTSFRLSKLRVARSGTGLNVSFAITNTGRRTGDDVAQVYVGPAARVPAGVQQTVRSLAGFDRVVLSPGHTRRLTIHIGPGRDLSGYGDRRAFQYWSTASQGWATAAGARRIWVGDADTGSRLRLAGMAAP
jgi:beta-glucosidase